MKKIGKITNVIASDKWEYFDSKRNKISSEIIIGRPVKSKEKKRRLVLPYIY